MPENDSNEAVSAQLRDTIWTYAQYLVVLLVCFLGGVFTGYQLWGQATQLQERVDELTERNQSLIKERDTERSKVALIERDKKELEKRLQDAKAAAAAAADERREGAPAAADQPS